MLFEVKNGTISLGGQEILSHFDFKMVDGEKIGIVGRNGAGKTTFLKLMTGETELDYNDDNTKGELIKSKDNNIAYLKQKLNIDDENNVDITESITAYEFLLQAFNDLIEIEKKIDKINEDLAINYDEKKAIDLNRLIDTYTYNGGETYIIDIKTGFKKFGFKDSELNKKMTEFSGGEATKVSLLKLILLSPDLLVLDEPTNHLDVVAIDWMEKYLQKSKKNVVIVSHDRMFLDNVCSVIYDVENKIMTRYEGNYSDYVEQKKINYELNLATYNKNLKEIERLTALAERFRYKATKAKMVKSKEKVIEKIKEKNVKPKEADTKTFNVNLKTNKKGGKEVFTCVDLKVGYDSSKVVASIPNFIIFRGDRLGIIGANGIGKSTFIKMSTSSIYTLNLTLF